MVLAKAEEGAVRAVPGAGWQISNFLLVGNVTHFFGKSFKRDDRTLYRRRPSLTTDGTGPPMADETNKTPARKAQSLNGATDHNEGNAVAQRRRGRQSQHPTSLDWRLLLSGNQMGLLAIVISIVSALYTAGWIPGIAKQTDVTELSRQIVEIKSGITSLSSEFSQTRTEFIKATASIARIEGRLEADAQVRARATRKPEAPNPKPVKAKGLFD
jgi:outer membrane murein-binding lipoprotein Lpp